MNEEEQQLIKDLEDDIGILIENHAHLPLDVIGEVMLSEISRHKNYSEAIDNLFGDLK